MSKDKDNRPYENYTVEELFEKRGEIVQAKQAWQHNNHEWDADTYSSWTKQDYMNTYRSFDDDLDEIDREINRRR